MTINDKKSWVCSLIGQRAGATVSIEVGEDFKPVKNGSLKYLTVIIDVAKGDLKPEPVTSESDSSSSQEEF